MRSADYWRRLWGSANSAASANRVRLIRLT